VESDIPDVEIVLEDDDEAEADATAVTVDLDEDVTELPVV
jgi:hypothetical protein